jgi:glucosamine--fructose-6-phosphate aminotransferase (isomerizing)
LTSLPERARAILAGLYEGDASDLLGGDRRHYFLGTGPNVATALEAALLCKEKLFLHAEGSGAADFIHGPLEALDEESTVWLFTVEERLDDLMLPLARRVRQTGAQLVVIGERASALSEGDISPLWTYDIALQGPEELGALLFILPVQMMVLWEAARRGYPIDTFRRMDKVMTGYDYGLSSE